MTTITAKIADEFMLSLRYREPRLGYTATDADMQAATLERLADDLAFIATEIPAALRERTLGLWERPYAFERNPTRWKSERYFLVDRGYERIGFPVVSFTREELFALGFEHWSLCSVVEEAANLSHTFPLLTDSVKYRGEWFLPLAALLQRAADYLRAQTKEQRRR